MLSPVASHKLRVGNERLVMLCLNSIISVNVSHVYSLYVVVFNSHEVLPAQNLHRILL